jgi:transposase
MAGGRPTKLDAERQERIVLLLRQGNYVETAAALAGIDKTTLYDWLRRGMRARDLAAADKEVEERELPYAEFSHAIERALAEGEAFHLSIIAKAASEGVWQASAWTLERRYPDRYGRRERIEHAGSIDTGPEFAQSARERLTRILDGIAARGETPELPSGTE